MSSLVDIFCLPEAADGLDETMPSKRKRCWVYPLTTLLVAENVICDLQRFSTKSKIIQKIILITIIIYDNFMI